MFIGSLPAMDCCCIVSVLRMDDVWDEAFEAFNAFVVLAVVWGEAIW